jgi:hypothetical protein
VREERDKKKQNMMIIIIMFMNGCYLQVVVPVA